VSDRNTNIYIKKMSLKQALLSEDPVNNVVVYLDSLTEVCTEDPDLFFKIDEFHENLHSLLEFIVLRDFPVPLIFAYDEFVRCIANDLIFGFYLDSLEYTLMIMERSSCPQVVLLFSLSMMKTDALIDNIIKHKIVDKEWKVLSRLPCHSPLSVRQISIFNHTFVTISQILWLICGKDDIYCLTNWKHYLQFHSQIILTYKNNLDAKDRYDGVQCTIANFFLTKFMECAWFRNNMINFSPSAVYNLSDFRSDYGQMCPSHRAYVISARFHGFGFRKNEYLRLDQLDILRYLTIHPDVDIFCHIFMKKNRNDCHVFHEAYNFCLIFACIINHIYLLNDNKYSSFKSKLMFIVWNFLYSYFGVHLNAKDIYILDRVSPIGLNYVITNDENKFKILLDPHKFCNNFIANRFERQLRLLIPYGITHRMRFPFPSYLAQTSPLDDHKSQGTLTSISGVNVFVAIGNCHNFCQFLVNKEKKAQLKEATSAILYLTENEESDGVTQHQVLKTVIKYSQKLTKLELQGPNWFVDQKGGYEDAVFDSHFDFFDKLDAPSEQVTQLNLLQSPLSPPPDSPQESVNKKIKLETDDDDEIYSFSSGSQNQSSMSDIPYESSSMSNLSSDDDDDEEDQEGEGEIFEFDHTIHNFE
jgi:hypothetical protein